MIIIPNNYNPANWQSTFVGTGPFVLGSYTPKVGATFTRNESYWGTKALPSQTQFTFYDTASASVLALTGGSIDVLGQFAVTGGEALLSGGYNVIKLKSSAHRELSMRNDQAPFTDPRVRQAIALTLNRPQIVTALFKGFADLGNDSPFAPVFPSTNTSVPQRVQNISQAKSLLSAAGHPSGFSTQLITEDLLEIPDYAQIVVQSAAQIGVKINLKVESSSQYYGKATFGNSDWLDATMSLVDYGHRSVPNVFLTAPLVTTNATSGTGPWNAAHFNNSQYNSLVAKYIAAIDLSTQRSLAGQIETLLLSPDADHLRVLLQLPDGDGEGRHGCVPDRDRAPVPVQRGEELILGRAVRLMHGHGARRIREHGRGAQTGKGSPDGGRPAERWPMSTGHEGGHHHRDVSGGWLRPAVFGAMDGLVTNVSLISGVGGGGGKAHTIVLTGLAGLAAGACSMAAGEYVSVSSQNELIHAEVDKERLELEHNADAEEAELAAMLRDRGVSAATARQAAAEISAQPEKALAVHVLEELGIDPSELPSPLVAAGASMASFAVGALIPLLGYLVGVDVLGVALGLAAVAAVVGGGMVARLTGRPFWRGALRQLALGGCAAGITYLIGILVSHVIG